MAYARGKTRRRQARESYRFWNSDPYVVLGVRPDASLAEIKRAYHRLAQQHHPDKNLEDTAAAERFMRLDNAYKTLSDPAKRTKHDQERQRAQKAALELILKAHSSSGQLGGFRFPDGR
jgi:curved DNA-binding protein CbpA